MEVRWTPAEEAVALKRAYDEHIEVEFNPQQDCWFSTSSDGQSTYKIKGGRCSCWAGATGKLCKHLAKVHEQEVQLGWKIRCDHCGQLVSVKNPMSVDQWERIIANGLAGDAF